MKNQLLEPLFTIIIFVVVCVAIAYFVNPFSPIILLGATAGIASAIVILLGVKQLIWIVVGCVIASVILNFGYHVKFNLAVFCIALLAVCSQALFAYKLVNTLLVDEHWLDNRKKILCFMLKIGPQASLISALSSVLISILIIKSFDINFIYVFCQTWSMSILITVFVTPIFLFLHSKNINRGKRVFVVSASIIVGLLIALLFKIGQDRNEHFRIDNFNKVKASITLDIEHELEHIEQQIKSLKAHFEASNFVELDSFNKFSDYLLSNNSKIESFEWANVVSHQQKSRYEQYMSTILDNEHIISVQTISGEKINVSPAQHYLPVQYVYPRYQNERILGVDLFRHSDKNKAINHAIKTGKPTATLPINTNQSDFSNPVVLVMLPVYSPTLKPKFGLYNVNNALPVTGMVIAVVRISTLFEQMLKRVSQKNINLFVKDIQSNNLFTIFGQQVEKVNRIVSENTIDFFTRQWTYELSENGTWYVDEKQWQLWAILIGGTLTGLIFQLLILMMAAYSSELSYRVIQKTRELIIAKEKSDQENQAKTNFLQSLSVELKAPVNVIKRLADVFPQTHLKELEKDYIDNISSASVNLEKLLDTLNELSNVESGRLIFNKQPFDFIAFLKRMDANVKELSDDYTIIKQEDIPQFIESDELRLQQIFMTCAENAKELLGSSNICISIKVYFHHQSSATIVFILHVLQSDYMLDESPVSLGDNQKDKHFNIRMEMARELSNKLGGNIVMSELPSGESIIHASVKVNVSQEQELGFEYFNLSKNEALLTENVKPVLYLEGKNKNNKNLSRQLSSLKYTVDVVSTVNEINLLLGEKEYCFIVYDCTEDNADFEHFKTPKDYSASNIPTLAVFNTPLNDKNLSAVNHKFSAYIVLPVTTENLRSILNNYLS